MALIPCSDLSAAEWIIAGDRPWQQVVCFGPAGFPAYARLRFLPDPAYPGQSENDVHRDGDAPSDTVRLRAALETLTRHTRTPEDCYFCLWDGWTSTIEADPGTPVPDRHPGTARPGRQSPPASGVPVPGEPKVVLPHRAYLLFHGAVSDIPDPGAGWMWPGQPGSHTADPAFVWPADHAWCLARDVDPHWAGIGASIPAINHLLADSRLDVVPADPRQDQPRYR